MMEELLVDSSVLLALFNREVSLSFSDVLETAGQPCRVIMLSGCVQELEEKLRRSKGGRKSLIRSVLRNLDALAIEVVSGDELDCDSSILAHSNSKLGSIVVATFDNELKNRLLEGGVPVVYIRAGKKLVLEGPGT